MCTRMPSSTFFPERWRSTKTRTRIKQHSNRPAAIPMMYESSVLDRPSEEVEEVRSGSEIVLLSSSGSVTQLLATEGALRPATVTDNSPLPTMLLSALAAWRSVSMSVCTLPTKMFRVNTASCRRLRASATLTNVTMVHLMTCGKPTRVNS